MNCNRASSAAEATAVPLGLRLGHNTAARSIQPEWVMSPCNHKAINYALSSRDEAAHE